MIAKSTLMGALTVSTLLFSSIVFAHVFPLFPHEEVSSKEADNPEVSGAVTLQKMIVHGNPLTPEEKLAVRVVLWAMDTVWDDDRPLQPRCTINGTWQYLFCGVNANSTLWRSKFPVNKLQLRQMAGYLGSEGLNREIVLHAIATGEVPRGLPDKPELAKFTEALVAVRGIRSHHDDLRRETMEIVRGRAIATADTEMAAAINAAGLTVKRYNEISIRVEKYPALQTMVRKLVAR